nr:putative ribonuclease H-like domain-containing protein [Tanacetum cinerariifolium]
VLVTKPHDKNPYELLTGDKLSISYLKPFGYHVTILNTSDQLGKFDKKSDEGTGQAWMFDIDYLTDSLNYSRVSSTNLTAGSQSATPCTAVIPIVDEATTKNNGTEEADRLGLAFPSLNSTLGVGSASISSFISAGSTPPVSAGSTPAISLCASPISVDRHSISAGKCHVFVGRPSGSADRTPVPANIHDGLKIFDCPKFGIFTSSSYDEEFVGPDANNLERSLDVRSTITKRIHNIHPTSQVWVLVTLPDGKRTIGTKWILKNKRDARGIVCRDKARLVAKGHRQEEWIDYSNVFAPVARIEVIRLFLAFASFMGFRVYQMDVKSAFLYGKIFKEVYVTQPRGFEDLDHLKKVYKVVKALYGLHQAPRAWYERLYTFLLKHGYRRGTINVTPIFVKKTLCHNLGVISK